MCNYDRDKVSPKIAANGDLGCAHQVNVSMIRFSGNALVTRELILHFSYLSHPVYHDEILYELSLVILLNWP